MLGKGESLLLTKWRNDFGTFVDNYFFEAWRNQALTLLKSLFGEDHTYVIGFHKSAFGSLDNAMLSTALEGLGVRNAAREDFRNGYLLNLKEIVLAELFADFLEQASYLVREGGFKDAGAVIAGSALESHLRQLCEKHGIDTQRETGRGPAPKKASALGNELTKEAVYNKIEWGNVDAWLRLRNETAHSHYDNYDNVQIA